MGGVLTLVEVESVAPRDVSWTHVADGHVPDALPPLRMNEHMSPAPGRSLDRDVTGQVQDLGCKALSLPHLDRGVSEPCGLRERDGSAPDGLDSGLVVRAVEVVPR